LVSALEINAVAIIKGKIYRLALLGHEFDFDDRTVKLSEF
jgi:hypothetical protein